MNFTNQYISQCISCASNNLRLTTEKIEIVTLFRSYLEKEDDLRVVIFVMKQRTEISKLAIKLDTIFKYISNDKINFLEISEKFKEHCSLITEELGKMLDVLTPTNTSKMIEEILDKKKRLSANEKKEDADEDNTTGNGKEEKSGIDGYGFTFEDFEKKVLKPIKPLDEFLNRLMALNYTEKEINEKIDLIKLNGDLSHKIGFDIISGMHEILSTSLMMIRDKKISPSKESVESMKACLIVIVAVIRGKEVDITKYLNRAEAFGRDIIKNTREML